MSRATAAFGPHLASVGEARRFVRRALIDLGAEHLDFEACQVVSELATNCVIHAATPFEVDLEYESDLLHVRVSDGSPRTPLTKSHSSQATTGRGLRLVAGLAERWGTETRPDGKTIWCTLRPGTARREVPDVAGGFAELGDAGDARGSSRRRVSGAGLSDMSEFRAAA